MLDTDVTWIPRPELIAAYLAQVSHNIKTVRQPLVQARDEVAIEDIKENFKTESYFISEGNGPVKWAPLAWRTVVQRGNAHPILNPPRAMEGFRNRPVGVMRTKLKSSAISKARWVVKGNEVMFTSMPQPYARAMQHGYDQIPARPYIALRGDAADRTQKIFEDWVESKVAQVRWPGV